MLSKISCVNRAWTTESSQFQYQQDMLRFSYRLQEGINKISTRPLDTPEMGIANLVL